MNSLEVTHPYGWRWDQYFSGYLFVLSLLLISFIWLFVIYLLQVLWTPFTGSKAVSHTNMISTLILMFIIYPFGTLHTLWLGLFVQIYLQVLCDPRRGGITKTFLTRHNFSSTPVCVFCCKGVVLLVYCCSICKGVVLLVYGFTRNSREVALPAVTILCILI